MSLIGIIVNAGCVIGTPDEKRLAVGDWLGIVQYMVCKATEGGYIRINLEI